jgi:hypothetical protein
MQTIQPRLDDIDLDWAVKTRASLSQLPRVPQTASQLDYFMYADQRFDLALFDYALGEPLEAVRAGIAEAATANLKVFELRGTQRPMPLTVSGQSARRPDAVDYSLTNSRRGLLAMHQALLSHHGDLVSRIAKLVNDPPDADYVGPDSEVCTPADQRVAYAMKALVLNDDPRALAELRAMSDAPADRQLDARMLEAIVTRDGAAFLGSLHDRLFAMRLVTVNAATRRDPHLFLGYSQLGLSILARRRGVVELDDLPRGDLRFPMELAA